MNRIGYICLILVFFVVLSGCSRQQIRPSEPKCLPGNDKAQLMQTVEDVLRQMHFVVEKYDVKSGFIKTRQLSAAQFFEFWRSDNVDRASAAQANLHSMQRAVQLNISESSNGFCVECNVEIRRLSIPEEEIIGTSHGAGMFTKGSESLQMLKMKAENAEWVDMGSDAGLETKILDQIEQRLKN